MSNPKDTYTITFGDQAENNVGMQKIGKISKIGFSFNELEEFYQFFKNDFKMEFINLNEKGLYESKYEEIVEETDKACLLVLRNFITNADDLYNEQKKLIYDSKALMRGQVKNKLARHNICFDHKSQKADYEKGKGPWWIDPDGSNAVRKPEDLKDLQLKKGVEYLKEHIIDKKFIVGKIQSDDTNSTGRN